jgi:hypothetical protein
MRRVLLVMVVASATLVVSTARLHAQGTDTWIGKWVLNIDQSSWSPAELAPKSGTTVITASPDGGNAAVTDGVDAAGKKTHTEISYKFDGKEYELKGAPDPKTTRVYTRVDDHAYTMATKVNGVITTTSRVAVTADGKTRTLVTTGRDAQGRIIRNFNVYNKQ